MSIMESEVKESKRAKKKRKEEEAEKVRIYSMNVSRLPINTTVLGCVQEIKEYEISVILPGAVRGKLSITNVSDIYSKSLEQYTKSPETANCPKPKSIFAPGQLLPVRVLDKVESDKQLDDSPISLVDIELSSNPKDVQGHLEISTFLSNCNGMSISAAVKSVEEHGYLMDIGFSELSGFLSFEDARPFISSHHFTKLSVGQVVFCHVISSNQRLIKLTTKSPKSLKHKSEGESFPSSCLLPGLTVSATIVDVNEKGLELLIFSKFKAFVHRNHLDSIWDLPREDYEIGAVVRGIIMFVNPLTQVAALSLRLCSEVLSIQKIWASLRIGQIIEDAQLVGKDEYDNFIFKLPNELKGIAPRHEISDDYISNEDLSVIENRMPIGSYHKCRVKIISHLDGFVKLTLRPSLIDAEDIPIEKLRIGRMLQGVVKKMTKRGLVIRLGFAIKAFCPTIHYMDRKLPNPSKYFAPNQKVKCRIIRLDTKSLVPRIAVTCRPALLKKDLQILDDIKKAVPGFYTRGVVALIKEEGILIEFFNELRGYLSVKRLKKDDIVFREGTYTIGQILPVYVVDSDRKSNQIHLSLHHDVGEKDKRPSHSLPVGHIISCKIIRKEEGGFYLACADLKNQSDQPEIFLPKAHLSDFPSLTDQLVECFRPGDKVTGVMIFRHTRNLYIATRKSLIIHQATSNTKTLDIENFTEKSIQLGVLKNFKYFGFIIEFPGNIIGLVPTRFISRSPIDPLHSPYSLGQTLLVCIKAVKEDKNGKECLVLSMLPHDLRGSDSPSASILSHFLQDNDFIHHHYQRGNKDPLLKVLRSSKPGDIIPFRVVSSEDGLKVCSCKSESCDSPIEGLIYDEFCSTPLKIGHQGIATVLHVDLVQKRLILSSDESLIKKVRSAVKNDSYKRVSLGQTILGFVHLVAQQFILVSLQAHAIGALAYIPRLDSLNSLTTKDSSYTCGEKVYFVVDQVCESNFGHPFIIGHRSSTARGDKKLKKLVEKGLMMKPSEKKSKEQDSRSKKVNSSKGKEKRNNSDVSMSEIDQDEAIRIEDGSNESEMDEDVNIQENLDSESDIGAPKAKSRKRKLSEKQEKERTIQEEKSMYFKKIQSQVSSKKRCALDEDEGFIWDDNFLDSDESDSGGTPKKSRSRTKVERVDDLPPSSLPSKERIEKELVDSPGNVQSWLNYITYHLNKADILKAREICSTALERLDHRKENDILKVWMAKIAIEIDHGSPESLQSTLKQALSANDEFKVLNNLVKIYESMNKTELAEQIYKDMVKRFFQDTQVYIDFGRFYLQHNMKDACHNLFQRALKAIEKVNHIDLITKFAQLECEFGDLERAKSLFEAVIDNFPKRVDIWSVYIDMMIKYGLQNNNRPSDTISSVRLLFERAISLKVKPKKISFMFQKYIDFETKFGDERMVAEINAKALEYAKSASKES
ncbi:ribosomal RNA Processing 5 [Brevipalpus obovatus]|uniref:ribosomal RNA Processing 5 n=1 Tax=Brevipalpus obovatus TaxID=246614 RepID=UPI003D9DFB2E